MCETCPDLLRELALFAFTCMLHEHVSSIWSSDHVTDSRASVLLLGGGGGGGGVGPFPRCKQPKAAASVTLLSALVAPRCTSGNVARIHGALRKLSSRGRPRVFRRLHNRSSRDLWRR